VERGAQRALAMRRERAALVPAGLSACLELLRIERPPLLRRTLRRIRQVAATPPFSETWESPLVGPYARLIRLVLQGFEWHAFHRDAWRMSRSD